MKLDEQRKLYENKIRSYQESDKKNLGTLSLHSDSVGIIIDSISFRNQGSYSGISEDVILKENTNVNESTDIIEKLKMKNAMQKKGFQKRVKEFEYILRFFENKIDDLVFDQKYIQQQQQ